MNFRWRARYAFVWQEWVIEWEHIYGAAMNRIGAALMPSVNALSNLVSGYKHTDAAVQDCAAGGVYPADARCRLEVYLAMTCVT